MKKDRFASFEPMLTKKMENGRRITKAPSLPEIQRTSAEKIATFDKSYKRIINPHIYKVSLSEKLKNLKTELLVKTRTKESEIEHR